MKKRYIILAIILFGFITPKVNAATCTKSEIIKVKEKANNVKIEYVASEKTQKKGVYDIKITGLPEEIYIKEESTGKTYTSSLNENDIITLSRVSAGNYKFEFYYFHCGDQLVRTHKLTVPKYNYYSEHPLCDGVPPEEVQECDEWYQGKVTEELLTEKINEYKNKRGENEPTKIDKILETIKNFVTNYYLYIIGVVTVIIIVITIIITRRKRGRLE